MIPLATVMQHQEWKDAGELQEQNRVGKLVLSGLELDSITAAQTCRFMRELFILQYYAEIERDAYVIYAYSPSFDPVTGVPPEYELTWDKDEPVFKRKED